MANRYEVQPDVAIRIESIGGDLEIKGYPEPEIRARGDDPQVQVDNDGHSAIVTCSGDCRLRVPNGTSVSIEAVGGDARITDIEGNVVITTVGGDLVIRNTGNITITTVGGDVKFKRINGSVQVTTIGGDAELYHINGDIQIEAVSSDAQVKNVTGNCEIEQIGSDLILNTRFNPLTRYNFDTIGSDIMIVVRPDDNVRFTYPQEVQAAIEIDYANVEVDDDLESIILRDGAAVVELEKPGGMLRVVEDDDPGSFIEDMIPENLDEIINEQLERQIPDIQRKAEQAAERLRQRAEREAEKAQQHAERIRQEAERKAERMRQEAERHAERTRREAERQAERMQRQAERMAEHGKHKRKRGFGFDFSWPGGPGPIPPIPPIPPTPFVGFPGEKPKRNAGPARPQGEPVSNDERMAILRMVEEKRITVEEAERLLAAMEGQD